MPTIEDYDRLADKAEQVRVGVIELNAGCDTLHVPIPQQLALAWADVMTFPTVIREVGARRTATPPDLPSERHDEPPDLEEQ